MTEDCPQLLNLEYYTSAWVMKDALLFIFMQQFMILLLLVLSK